MAVINAINRTLRIMDEIAVMGMLAHFVDSYKSSFAAFPRGLVALLIIVVLALVWDFVALAITAACGGSGPAGLAIADFGFFVAVIVGVALFGPWVLNEKKNNCATGTLGVNVTWGSNCLVPKVLWGFALGLVPSFLISVVLDFIED